MAKLSFRSFSGLSEDVVKMVVSAVEDFPRWRENSLRRLSEARLSVVGSGCVKSTSVLLQELKFQVVQIRDEDMANFASSRAKLLENAKQKLYASATSVATVAFVVSATALATYGYTPESLASQLDDQFQLVVVEQQA